MVTHTKDSKPWDVLGQAPNARDSDEIDGDDLPSVAGERVAKALARAGVASRREVERLIEAGRVRVNGQVLTTPAVKVAPDDILTVDGAVVGEAEPTRMWRYHKPVGLVTTHKDPQGRPTVFEALPKELPRVISVGRLDLNSEGLLLLTNDGALARALELPSSGWSRTYRVRAYGETSQSRLDRLLTGLTLDGVKYGPIVAKLDKVKEGKRHTNVWITVTLSEGKNREVRKVLDSIGLQVNRLIRLAYGPFQLGTLPVGAAEEIGPRVVREQLSAYIAEANLPIGSGVTVISQTQAQPDRRNVQIEGPRPEPVARRVVSAPQADAAEAERMGPIKKKPGWAKAKPKRAPLKPKAQKAGTDAAKPIKAKHYRAGPSKGATLIEPRPSGPRSSGARPGGTAKTAVKTARPRAGTGRPGSGPKGRSPRP